MSIGSVSHRGGDSTTGGVARHDSVGASVSRVADGWTVAFYVAVAATAYVGQVSAAVSWLGVAMAARADARRRLGERAYGYRLLSAAVAAFAVGLNWVGHGPGTVQAWFFAGMSAVGYAVWLLQSDDRRRDALRAAGMAPQQPPVFGLAQWMREPHVTWQARLRA